MMRNLLFALALSLWPTHASAQELGVVGPEWESIAIGDFDGDGKPDLLMRRKTDGLLGVWLFNGAAFKGWYSPGAIGTDWALFGLGDFNGDKRADTIWRHPTGMVYLQLMSSSEPPPPDPGPQVLLDLTGATWGNPYGSGTQLSFRMDGGGLQVPQSGSIHYIVATGSPLQNAGAIKFQIEVLGDDTIVPLQAGDPPPAKVRLFIGTNDLTFAHLRFWSDEWIKIGHGTDAANPNPSGLGIHEMTVPLDPAKWHTADGTHDPGAFVAMLANPMWIGHTYAGQFSDGHGIRGNTPNNIIALRSYQIIGK